MLPLRLHSNDRVATDTILRESHALGSLLDSRRRKAQLQEERTSRMRCSTTRCLFKKRTRERPECLCSEQRLLCETIAVERSQAQADSVSNFEYSPLGGLMWTPRLSACSFATATLQRTFFSISDSVRSDVFCRVTRRPAVPAQVHFPCDQKRNRRVCRHWEMNPLRPRGFGAVAD